MTEICVAIKQEDPPTMRSFVTSLRALFDGTAPRCGEPATKRTPLGPLCDACYERIETGRKNRTNLLGLIEEARERRQ